MEKTIKKLFSIICIVIVSSVILLGCSIPAGGAGESKKNQYIEKNDSSISNDPSISTKMIGSYPAGMAYYDIDTLNYGNSSTFLQRYNDWKAIHVVSSGANGYLRVKRDPASLDDTVSEGIGYGMLLAVYFNDQTTFDGLYKYCKYHFIKVNGTTVPLMHWKEDANGNNVSEFADYAMDTSVIKVSGTSYTSYASLIPHSIVYGNLTTGRVFITRTETQYDSLRTALDNNPNYYRMCKETRGYSSATDADEDIAAALCFASKKWSNSGSINYSQEATNMINAMKQYDFMSDGFVKNGNTWGGQNGWNPSYFAPGYYINVYQKHTGDTFWTTAYNRMYNEMNVVKNNILNQNGNNKYKVFFPDWCDTTNGGLKKATNTDRLYYNNGQQSDPRPTNGPGGFYLDARWKDNTTKEDYKSSFISFNSYYDAIRVPWRIATDYLWGGSRAWEIMEVVNKSFQNYYNFKNPGEMGDGCSITGGLWNFADRDGFNRSGGGGTPSGVFRFMASCAQVVSGTLIDSRFSQNTRYSNIFESSSYCYYTNCMNMFTGLMLSGKFQNLYDSKSSNPTTPVQLYRYWSGNDGDHFYTIDYSELGSGKWGYVSENYEGFVYKTSVIDGGKTTAFFRLYNSNTKDHYYTTSWNDVFNASNYYGYTYEGIACNVYTNSNYGGKPLYRYWSNGAGDHFYSIQNTDLRGYGYVYEGIACYVLY